MVRFIHGSAMPAHLIVFQYFPATIPAFSIYVHRGAFRAFNSLSRARVRIFVAVSKTNALATFIAGDRAARSQPLPAALK